MKPYCYSRCEGCKLGFLTARGSLGVHRLRLILARWTPPGIENDRWICPNGCVDPESGRGRVVLRVDGGTEPATAAEINAMWAAFNAPRRVGIRARRKRSPRSLHEGTTGD